MPNNRNEGINQPSTDSLLDIEEILAIASKDKTTNLQFDGSRSISQYEAVIKYKNTKNKQTIYQ